MWDLAIDPGLRCGWAIRNCDSGAILSGSWDLRPRMGDGAGVRFLRLQAKLNKLLEKHTLRCLVYEIPGHFRSLRASASVKGMVAHLQSWAEERKIPYFGYLPKQIKRYATGKGNASKQAVHEAARRRWPEQEITHNDQADALWVLALAQEEVT